jgi:hypothetical protein
MREDARHSFPTCLSVAPCSEPSRPSPAGGRQGRPVLTAPARGALQLLQAGTKERPSGTNKGTVPNKAKRWRSTAISIPAEVCERMRRDGGSVFTAHAKSGDPNGPLEVCPLMRTHAR